MFIPVIMGFGHSGRALHLRCLRTLFAADGMALIGTDVHVVDPRPDATATEPRLTAHAQLPPAASLSPGVPVLHVCTPPLAHAGPRA